jgi:tetratricopeptide (TPR) repeat protein
MIPAKPEERSHGVWAAVMAAAIFLALAAIYWPLHTAGFIWNDSDYVTAPALRSFAGLRQIWFKLGATEQYYPLLHSFFWLQHRAYGDAAPGYHAMGVLLHGIDACLVALMLRELLGRATPATRIVPWLAAALFAVHPVMVESVAWISEQKNTLSLVFYLGGLACYLRFDRTRSRGTYALASGLFVCALLSKTVTATAPGAAGLLVWWRHGKLNWRRDLVPLLPWCAAGAAAGLFSGYVERVYLGAGGADFNLTPAERLLVAGRASWFYAGHLLWPAQLKFIYERWTLDVHSAKQWAFPLGVIALTALLWPRRGRSRTPCACWLFFLGSLFPILGFLNVYAFVFSFVADHFQYLASLGIFTGAAALIAALAQRAALPFRVVLGVITAVGLGALARRSREETAPYHDVTGFYRTILARNPASWLAWNNLGLLAYDAHDLPTALADYDRALALHPHFAEALNDRGIVLGDLGRWSESEASLKESLVEKYPFPPAEFNLVRTLVAENHLAEADTVFAHALPFFADAAQTRFFYGNILQGAGHQPEALRQYQLALTLRPGDAAVYASEGASLLLLNENDQALVCFQAAIRLAPHNADAHYNAGLAYVRKGLIHDAVVAFEAANQIDPTRPDVYRQLADLLQRSGHAAQAAQFLQRAQIEEAKRASPVHSP